MIEYLPYAGAWLIAGAITVALIPLVKRLAGYFGVVDDPGGNERKRHNRPIPLLGGVAIAGALLITIWLFRLLGWADFGLLDDQLLISISLAIILIMIGGWLDDAYNLRPWQQIIWPIMATAVVIGGGLDIHYLTNPIGGPSNAIIYVMPWVSAAIIAIWLMGMMYTTKFLDGLDGLVGGITTIASIIIFVTSLNWDSFGSATGILAIALAGAMCGFLIFNWHPASIFLGEGGSLLAGFMLGILSVMSGSKIMTTLLVVGIPILDVAWVIVQRLLQRQSPFSHADRKHLHYQLMDHGWSHRGTVLLLYVITLLFGWVAVITTSVGKIIGIIALIIVMAGLIIFLRHDKKIADQN